MSNEVLKVRAYRYIYGNSALIMRLYIQTFSEQEFTSLKIHMFKSAKSSNYSLSQAQISQPGADLM